MTSTLTISGLLVATLGTSMADTSITNMSSEATRKLYTKD